MRGWPQSGWGQNVGVNLLDTFEFKDYKLNKL